MKRKWTKISPDDFRSGEYSITRLPAEENAYTHYKAPVLEDGGSYPDRRMNNEKITLDREAKKSSNRNTAPTESPFPSRRSA